jgi:serine/threonine protein kinase
MGGFARPVVIKRILPELALETHFVRMFIDEARLSALLDHPNIVQVQDFGVIDGTYFIAMEYIEGITLHHFNRYYNHRRPVPPDAAAYVMHQVCLGLEYAHSLTRDGLALGLVHRDISPSNIMISGHGVVKLLDFGIAKAVEVIDREETRTGTLKGKWSYMSPEQVMGEPATPKSDIFSGGIVFWEMLTGRRLFKDKTDFLTLSKVVQAKVPPVTAFRKDLPKIFDVICAKALARRAKDRYQSADQMASHLENYLTWNPYTSTKLSAIVAPIMAERSRARVEEITTGSDEEGSRRKESSAPSHSSVSAPAGTNPSPVPLDDGEDDADAAAPTAVPGPSLLLPPEETTSTVSEQQGLSGTLVDPLEDSARPTGTAEAELPFFHSPEKVKTDETLVAGVPAPVAEEGEPADLSGTLASRTLAKVMFHAHVERETGLLVLRGREGLGKHARLIEKLQRLREQIEFPDGVPDQPRPTRAIQLMIHCAEGKPHLASAVRTEEAFVAHLIGKGVLAEEPVWDMLQLHPQRKPIAALLASGALTALQVSRYLITFIQDNVLDTFSWTEGDYAFYRGRDCPVQAFPTGLDAMRMIVKGVARIEEPILENYCSRLIGRRLGIVSSPPVPIEKFNPNPMLLEAYFHMNSSPTFDEVLAACLRFGEPVDVKRAVFLLIECELAHAV